MPHTSLTLSVGCGNKPTGHVNVDLFVESEQHRGSKQRAYRKPLSHKTPFLTCADIHSLPFSNNAFREVHCFDLLEHKGVDFNRALRELLRVCSLYVIFTVPSVWDYRSHPRRNKAHARLFSHKQLNRLLKPYPHDITVDRLGRLIPFIPLYVPFGYRVMVWKGDSELTPNTF